MHSCPCGLYSPWLWKVKRPGVSVFLARWVILQHVPSALKQERERAGDRGQFTRWYSDLRASVHVNNSLQVGIGEVQVSSLGWLQHSGAHLHPSLVIHKPLSVGGKANHVPLACNLKERRKGNQSRHNTINRRLNFTCITSRYLFHAEVFHGHDISAGSQHAHQGGHHPQQCVPHGCWMFWASSAARSDQESAGRCNGVRPGGGFLYAPAAFLPLPSPPSCCCPRRYKNSLASTQRHANHGSYTTGTCGRREREKGKLIHNRGLLTHPRQPLLRHKCPGTAGQSKQLFGKRANASTIWHMKAPKTRSESSEGFSCPNFSALKKRHLRQWRQ